MIVAVPAFSAVIRPSPLMLATFLRLLLHFKAWSASAGSTLPLNCRVSPTFSTTVPLTFRFTRVALGGFTTFTFTLACLPLSVVTEMIALPLRTARTRPFSSTVAIFVLLLFHVSFAEALAGV